MAEEYKLEVTSDGKVLLKKRFQFKCWKCNKVYSIYREADLMQKLQVSCPFCDAKADVDFRPFEARKKGVLRQQATTDTKTIYRVEQEGKNLISEYKLPPILPTSKLK